MAQSSSVIRIVIALDHALLREGLRSLLNAETGLQVLGEAGDGTEAVKLVRQLQPHILLLDLTISGRPCLEALRELAVAHSPVRTLLLASTSEKKLTVEALRLGARGVVLKESAGQLLIKGIRAVMEGKYWVGHESVAELVDCLRELTEAVRDGTVPRVYGLTPRELQIVSLVVAGHSNKNIAEKFSLSEDTVKHHVSNIFDKLGVCNRLELALFAVKNRLVPDL